MTLVFAAACTPRTASDEPHPGPGDTKDVIDAARPDAPAAPRDGAPPADAPPNAREDAQARDAASSFADTAAVATDAGVVAADTGAAAADTGAPPDAAPQGCPGLFCEGFEDVAAGAAPNPAQWSKEIYKNGSLEVSAAHAHRGKNALHVKSPDGSLWTYIKHKKSFPVRDNVLYGRLFFYLQDYKQGWANGQKNVVHFDLFEARGAAGFQGNRVRVGVIEAADLSYGSWFLFNVQGPSTEEVGLNDMSDAGRKRVPKQTWICVEWMLNGKAGAQEARTWVGGEELTALRASASYLGTKWEIPQMTELNVGFSFYQRISPNEQPDPSQFFEAYIDDVALGSERIGCDR